MRMLLGIVVFSLWLWPGELVSNASAQQAELAEVLLPGDKAPALTLGEFVKGERFDSFQDGMVYIVEFWATWCGPCKSSIPHLTKLQKTYNEELRVLGVAIMEHDPTAVGPYVESMGDQMDYAVAIDDRNQMSTNWMEAAQQGGIPTAFIVDRKGRIAWIGHPLDMDEPLGQVIAGTYDLDAVLKERERLAQVRAASEGLMQRLNEQYGAGQIEEAIETMDELVALDPGEFGELAIAKFQVIALQVGDWDRAYAFAAEIITDRLANESAHLGTFSWYLLTDASVTDRRLDVAIEAAERAVELTRSSDGDLLDTLALAYSKAGLLEDAVEAQRKAVEAATEAQRGLFQKTLEQYTERLQRSRG
ncbi:MAG: redoxin family protein [Planctomycetota bacterium]